MVMCFRQKAEHDTAHDSSSYAVLLMAYGGPDSLEDVEPFIMDIRGGRQTPPELVEEIRERYARIGGRSPLREITSDQGGALETLLNAPEDDERSAAPASTSRVYIGMRHWQPYIADTLAEIVHAGYRKVVTMCMTPAYSQMTVGSYLQKFHEAQEKLGDDLDVVVVESWHTHPLYIEAVAEKVRAALREFPDDTRGEVQLVFSTHSLPASIVEEGDPYDAHMREIARLVIERLEMGALQSPPLSRRWHFCYQSAGARKVVWLGPSIEETLSRLAEEGHRHLLVVPIGFLCDHVEILYDIDVECQDLAAELGVNLKRIESLNTSPTFIRALADIVKQAKQKK